jgi:osmotically inducible protein OsmC
MALSAALERAGTPANRVETSAAATIEKVGDAFRITTMKLTVRANAPGVTADAFQKTAQATKDGCPVSNAIKGNVAIELDAALV